MKLKYCNCLLSIIIVLLCTNTYSQKTKLVDVSNAFIQYAGRIGMNNPGVAEIYWPGSSCKIKFTGTELKAILKDVRGDNYYNVIVDDKNVHVLKLDTAKKEYTLASHLPKGNHTVELFRRTDWTSGITWFYGFQLLPGSKIIELPAKKKND